jgi:Tfp pilus assembly protein PilV
MRIISRRLCISRQPSGYSFLEVLLTIALVGVGVVLSLSLLAYIRARNHYERIRSRAYEIVIEEMETQKSHIFSRLQPLTRDVVLWDGDSPDDPSDDLHGELEVFLKDYQGNELVQPPTTPGLVQIEVTLTWETATGRQHETLMTYRTP